MKPTICVYLKKKNNITVCSIKLVLIFFLNKSTTKADKFNLCSVKIEKQTKTKINKYINKDKKDKIKLSLNQIYFIDFKQKKSVFGYCLAVIF